MPWPTTRKCSNCQYFVSSVNECHIDPPVAQPPQGNKPVAGIWPYIPDPNAPTAWCATWDPISQ